MVRFQLGQKFWHFCGAVVTEKLDEISKLEHHKNQQSKLVKKTVISPFLVIAKVVEFLFLKMQICS